MAHTPGPWTSWIGRSGRLAEVAQVEGNPYAKHICEIGKKHNPNFEADALLIAAAPDLLEACKDLVEYFGPDNEDGIPNGVIVKAQAAIAKAEGGVS